MTLVRQFAQIETLVIDSLEQRVKAFTKRQT